MASSTARAPAARHLLAALTLAAVVVPALAQESLLRGQRAAARRADGDDVTETPVTPRVVVELLQASVRPGAKSALADSETHFYIGTVRVGGPRPQELSVLFDTAAGNLVLPAWNCRNASCLERRRYSPFLSETSVPLHLSPDHTVIEGEDAAGLRDVIHVGFMTTDLGDGEIFGEIVKDRACIGLLEGAGGRSGCADLGILTATEMDEGSFWGMPADGIFGLGLEALTVSNPLFSLPRQLVSTHPGMLPRFTLSLRGARGEIAFGGPPAAAPTAAPIVWRPVDRPVDGYWQVQIQAVRVGNRTIDICQQGCRGIVDGSASRLGVPPTTAPLLAAALAVVPVSGGGCRGPRLHFDLGGGAVLTLRPEDYAGSSCKAVRLSTLDLEPAEIHTGTFVWGESLLRRYDVTFDWGAGRVGFSPAAVWAVRLGPPEEESVEVYQV